MTDNQRKILIAVGGIAAIVIITTFRIIVTDALGLLIAAAVIWYTLFDARIPWARVMERSPIPGPSAFRHSVGRDGEAYRPSASRALGLTMMALPLLIAIGQWAGYFNPELDPQEQASLLITLATSLFNAGSSLWTAISGLLVVSFRTRVDD